MSLHPLAQHFASVAEAYELGRAEYPLAAVGALAAELRLGPGARILDLAAGTGKLSRALLAAGYDVVAVEPLPALREVLAAKIGAERVRDGVAEAIPLADASVDGVTVGDAFHWFDHTPALGEIRRVLRPGGGLAVLNTLPDWTGASWAHELGTLIQKSRPVHPGFDGPPWQEAVRAAGGWTDPREIRITTKLRSDPDRVVACVESMSGVAGMTGGERARMLETVRALVHGGDTPDEMPTHVVIGLTSLA